MARIRNGIIGAAVLAASLALGAAPAGAQDHDRGGGHGHFEGRGAPHSEGRGGPHFEGRGGPRYEGHYEGHFEGRPRYAVPQHWEGMHPHWDDDDRRGYWVRPWGPRWVPRYWGGGYWGGGYWPHVYLDWDFPWFMAALPIGSVTYWWGGVPYYYWQGVYYVWSPDYGQYVVTDPPPLSGGVAQGAAPPPAAAQPGETGGRGAMSLFVYPKNGQSEQQTQNDRYQCHEWAVGQTGFDPSNSANDTQASTATPQNYRRAVTACLEARGYSVR
ncbi:MAG: hypothetical protein KGJ72_12995 [Gammaproteobacteria bacterium]|nr:hypothetical protein [Gammaproteobacteria bacterium]